MVRYLAPVALVLMVSVSAFAADSAKTNLFERMIEESSPDPSLGRFEGVVTKGSEANFSQEKKRFLNSDIAGRRCSIKLKYAVANQPSLITGTYWKSFDFYVVAGNFETSWHLNTIASQGIRVAFRDEMPNPLRNGFTVNHSRRVPSIGPIHRQWSTTDNVLKFTVNETSQTWILFTEDFSRALLYRFQEDNSGHYARHEDITCETDEYQKMLAEARPAEGRDTKLVSTWTDQGKYCLDEATDRSLVYAHPCHGGDNQKFVYDVKTGQIRSKHSNRCLEVQTKGTRWGKQTLYQLGLSTCRPEQPNQFFRTNATTRGLEIRDGWKNFCLNIHHGPGPKYGKYGYEAGLYPCLSADHQRWMFQP